MKLLTKLFPIFILGIFIYLVGPSPAKPSLKGTLPKLRYSINNVEQAISTGEDTIKNIKPYNRSKIIWADPNRKTRTPYCLVYLHGFSASQEEGNPLHKDFAKRYGCNLYLPRLYGHGIEEKEALVDVTPDNFLESAKQAIAVARLLGEKVILMSTSTGGTLSLYIAAHNKEIAGLILYSPNIDLYDPNSFILTKRWGLQIAQTIKDSPYNDYNESNDTIKNFWTTRYRLEALVSLKTLINATMKAEVFEKVKQPVFLGYYYKNEDLQDDVVSVPKMLEMYDELGTPPSKKRKVAFPDAGAHCIGNRFKSKDISGVKRETFKFAEEILGLTPIANFQ